MLFLGTSVPNMCLYLSVFPKVMLTGLAVGVALDVVDLCLVLVGELGVVDTDTASTAQQASEVADGLRDT